MKKITGIYKIENLKNQKIYIGLSKNCIRRWYDHRSKSMHPKKKEDFDKPLYKAMRKYGLENFSFSILEECEEADLAEREIFWIEKLNSYDEGYNATHGGDLVPLEYSTHIGEEHGMAKLTEEEVIFCRECYQKGLRSKDIWEEHFKEKIGYSGFQRMWHGKSWAHILPETFSSRKHTRKRVSEELVKEILSYRDEHSDLGITAISKHFKGRAGYGTVYAICKTDGKETYSKRKK